MMDGENGRAWLAAKSMGDEERMEMERWKSRMGAAGLYHAEALLGRREYHGNYIRRTYTHVYLVRWCNGG